VLVGFAVETGDLVGYARSKLERKGCDLVVANLAEHGFEGDDNVVTLVTRERAEELGRAPKRVVAERILDRVRVLLRDSAQG
jgi:phosphopantothenoylcysteine decarboxylase/phosphopantothenate--cysteine ligase